MASIRVRYKELCLPNQFWNRFEISHRMVVGPEQFPVISGVFSQNAPADRRRFEAAHRMPVPVGAACKAQANPRGS